jgi:hypothetical protein
MLTFDEFRAVSNREKARQEEGKQAKPIKVKSGTTEKAPSQTAAPSNQPTRTYVGGLVDGVGEFLEIHHMQWIYVLIIVLDTFVALAEIILSCPTSPPTGLSEVNRIILVRLFSSFGTFATLFFTMEIVAVVVVFGRSMITHWGYVLDVLTTFGQIYLEQNGYSKVGRVLNIVRFWRLVRLLNSMVSIEKDLHEKTKSILEAREIEAKKLQLENASLSADIIKEKEARDAIEDMLVSYKEEVDTLNEALKIAAMDIAEVAQTEDDFALSEDGDESVQGQGQGQGGRMGREGEDEDEGQGEEEVYVDAASSRYSKVTNKSATMRAVMDDGRGGGGAQRRTGAGAGGGGGGPPTFLVHEDGTFEQK